MTAWLRLLRVALLPTVAWDVVAGAWLLDLPLGAWLWAPLAVAVLLYHAGMALNDYADRGADLQARPARPLPSGQLAPGAALAAGLGMIALALALAWWRLPVTARNAALLVAGIVLVYDLGGRAVRRAAGPVLLATARGCSFSLGALTGADAARIFETGRHWAVAAYCMYFLFLARLATYEEQGAAGNKVLAYLFGSALAPALLLQAAPWWPLYPGWALLAWWLLDPVFRHRHAPWEPRQVQAAVRRGLAAAPLLPGLSLLAAGQPLGAAISAGVALAVRALARRFPPE